MITHSIFTQEEENTFAPVAGAKDLKVRNPPWMKNLGTSFLGLPFAYAYPFCPILSHLHCPKSALGLTSLCMHLPAPSECGFAFLPPLSIASHSSGHLYLLVLEEILFMDLAAVVRSFLMAAEFRCLHRGHRHHHCCHPRTCIDPCTQSLFPSFTRLNPSSFSGYWFPSHSEHLF